MSVRAKRRHGIASANEKRPPQLAASFPILGAYLGPSLYPDGGIHRERGDARDRVDRPGVEPPLRETGFRSTKSGYVSISFMKMNGNSMGRFAS